MKIVLSYNKGEVKENLSMDDIYNLLEFLEAEPQMYGNYIIAKTICHSGETHKLYWYENTGLFKCYSGSCGSFDIFELIQKYNDTDDLNQTIAFVVNFCNLQSKVSDDSSDELSVEDWEVFRRYGRIAEIAVEDKSKIQLSEYDLSLFEHYPQPIISDWEKEGISKEVCDYMGIRYDPIEGGIIIPHFDENGRCIGIRSRTLVQENEKFGKYRPLTAFGQMFNHPLAFNLYGLDKAKENIEESGIAIVVESEKSVLKYLSYFGIAANLCVAVCGSSFSKYQFQLLQEYGAKEIVIGFDKDFEDYNDDKCLEVESKLMKIYDKYGAYANLSFLYDKESLLGYKHSPLDDGKEKFLHLFRNRVML